MDFNEWRELASEYVEGTLSTEKRTEVARFLAQSPEGRADEAALRALLRQLGATAELDPPLYFADNLNARLQAERAEAQRRSWRSWLPQLGRLTAGSLVAGGALAAVAWTVFFPNESRTLSASAIGGAGSTPSTATAGPSPRLVVSAPRLQGSGTDSPVLDFPLALENAERGTVIARVPGEKASGLFFQKGVRATNLLRLPLAPGATLATVELTWTGDGTKGEKWIVVPLEDRKDQGVHQTFVHPELPLVSAIAEVARAYGLTVVLEDLPRRDQRIRFQAHQETMEALLRRQLAPLGLSVRIVDGQVTVAPSR